MLDQNQMASLTSELDGSIRRAASRLETEFRAADRKIIDTVSTIAGDKSEEAQVDPEQPYIEAATKSEIPFEILVDYTDNSPTVYVRNGGFYGEDMFAGTDGSNTFATFDYMTLDATFDVSQSVWATLIVDAGVWTASLNTEEYVATGTQWVRNVLVGTIGSNGEVLQTVTGHIPADYGEVFARLDGSNQPFTGPITAPALTLDPAGSAVTGEGAMTWNPDEHTVNIDTGLGPVLQVGQELYVPIHNNSGETLLSGDVVYSTGILNGRITAAKACAGTHELISSGIAVVTMTIPDGEDGLVTNFGKVRGVDTSSYSPNPILYVSPDTPGLLTNVKPEFPNYVITVGAVTTFDAVDGVITVEVKGAPVDTIQNFWNGVFRETFDFLVTSTGGVITGSLSPANGHDDMTMMFSDGFTMLATTPAATIVLTAGTDANPQTNYVYIPKSTKVLTVSTSDWPTTVEHIKVAQVFLQTASTTETSGALRNQNWNDAIENTHTFQGHLSHIAERIRQIPASWDSGAEVSVASGGGSIWVSNTAGVIYQMHRQQFPALDTATGDDIHVVNQNYALVSDLSTLTLDASGGSLNNTSFSIVIWGVCNKTGEASHLMASMPTGTYNKNFPSQALEDASAYTVYSIPKAFNGVGFLMARLTFVNSGGIWTLYDNTDLRGRIPDTEGGGVGGTGVSTFTALTDTPSTYIGSELWFARVNAGGTALEFSQLQHTDLLPASVLPDQHHSQSHAHNGADGSGTIAHSDITLPNGETDVQHLTAAQVAALHDQNTDTGLGALGTKNPPIDADKIIYRDSADSDALVTSTWAQVKAFLKDYFDTLYNKYVHPNHSGDVTSVGDGAQTIAADAVTYAKMQNVVSDERILGRVSGAGGDVEELTKAQVLTMINVEDGAEANNISDTDATDLTDGGETALHVHAPHSELTNEILYEHDGGTYEACQPITYAGRYWRLVWVANYGDADFDGHTIAAGKRNFFMQQFCLPIYDVPGYCLYTTPVGELLSFGIPATGETEAQKVEDGILGGIGTEYSGTLSGGDPSTGDPVEATFVSGLCTDYEGLIVLGNDTTGESITLRIDSDDKIKQ